MGMQNKYLLLVVLTAALIAVPAGARAGRDPPPSVPTSQRLTPPLIRGVNTYPSGPEGQQGEITPSEVPGQPPPIHLSLPAVPDLASDLTPALDVGREPQLVGAVDCGPRESSSCCGSAVGWGRGGTVDCGVNVGWSWTSGVGGAAVG